jgi:hypothetical protein
MGSLVARHRVALRLPMSAACETGRRSLRGDTLDQPSVAIVTGASSGLGRCFALELSGMGTAIVAVARRRDESAIVVLGPRTGDDGPVRYFVTCRWTPMRAAPTTPCAWAPAE